MHKRYSIHFKRIPYNEEASSLLKRFREYLIFVGCNALERSVFLVSVKPNEGSRRRCVTHHLAP